VVLDLIVEPHLREVDPVASGCVVRGSQHLINVELLLVLVMVIEQVQIVSTVVGPDDDVRMKIGDQFSEHPIDENVQSRRCTQKEKKERNQQEIEDQVREIAAQPESSDQSVSEIEEVCGLNRGDRPFRPPPAMI